MIFTCKNTDKLYRGKSKKKLFPERYNNYERIMSPQNKKLFPLLTNQETNDKPSKVNQRPVVRIDKKFGKPTSQSILENDKKMLLPAEFNQKYNRQLSKHRHSYIISLNRLSLHSAIINKSGNLITSINTENENRYISPRRKYPYTRSSVQELLIQKNQPNKSEYTKKINENRFDILKFVPKYVWEY